MGIKGVTTKCGGLVAFKQRPEKSEGPCHEGIWRKSILGKGNRMYNGSEAGTCLIDSRNSKEMNVADAE